MAEGMTLESLQTKLAFFNKMYDAVRLVDPVQKRVIECRESKSGEESEEICYDYWDNGKICDNCISVRAYLGNRCFIKLEQSPGSVMIVTAIPVENAKRPTVLELLKNATDSLIVGNGKYEEGHTMHSMVAEINDLVVKDDLTGLYNRRYVDERLPADIVKSKLAGLPLSIIFLDIDNLKQINDTYGHAVGDTFICKVAGEVLQCIRMETDWAARHGGDEFLICLNKADKNAALVIAERIRARVENLEITAQNEVIRTTVSMGLYTMKNEELTAKEMIKRADQKMYEAKRKGKNFTAVLSD